MSPIDTLPIGIILFLLALGFFGSWWLLRRRRGIDRGGNLKGTARHPGEVRRENPPDGAPRM